MSDLQDLLSWATANESSIVLIAPFGWAGQSIALRKRMQEYVMTGFGALACKLGGRGIRILVLAAHEGERGLVENWFKDKRWFNEIAPRELASLRRNVMLKPIQMDPVGLCKEVCKGSSLRAPCTFPAVLVMQNGKPSTAVEGLLDPDIQAVDNVLSSISEKSKDSGGKTRTSGILDGDPERGSGGAGTLAPGGGGGREVGASRVQRAEAVCSRTLEHLIQETLDATVQLEYQARRMEQGHQGMENWQGVCCDEIKTQMEQLLASIKRKPDAPVHQGLTDTKNKLSLIHKDILEASRSLPEIGAEEEQLCHHLCASVKRLAMGEEEAPPSPSPNGTGPAGARRFVGQGRMPRWLEHQLAPLATLNDVHDKAARRAAEAPLVARVRERERRESGLESMPEIAQALPALKADVDPRQPPRAGSTPHPYHTPSKDFAGSPPRTPLPLQAGDARDARSSGGGGGKASGGSGPRLAYGLLNMSPGGGGLPKHAHVLLSADAGLSSPAPAAYTPQAPRPDSADQRGKRRERLWKTPLAQLLTTSAEGGGSGSARSTSTPGTGSALSQPPLAQSGRCLRLRAKQSSANSRVDGSRVCSLVCMQLADADVRRRGARPVSPH